MTGAGEIRLAMRRVMQRHRAVFREGPLLDEGRDTLAGVVTSLRDDLGAVDRSMAFNSDLVGTLESDDTLAQATVSPRSAIGRTESRGAHVREDYPKRDDATCLRHTLTWLRRDGSVELDYCPVRLQPFTKDVASIPPKQRVCRPAGPSGAGKGTSEGERVVPPARDATHGEADVARPPRSGKSS